MSQSQNCTNGNHSDCTGCTGCGCHAPERNYSGACADGDHTSCRMGTECACPHHVTTCTAVPSAGKPPWPTEAHRGTAWRVTLTYDGRSMETPFYMGPGHGRTAPTAAGVLECLATDASYVENGETAELVGEMSYAEGAALVTALEAQTEALRALMGDRYMALVFPGSDED